MVRVEISMEIQESDTGERRSANPDTHRVASVAKNLASVLQSPSDSPNRDRDIAARESTLERMGCSPFLVL